MGFKEEAKESLLYIFKFFKSLLTIFIIMGPSFYFGYIGRPVEMSIAIASGAIAASFLHIDKFSRFKGAGFEAEMKKVVKQAYATIDEIKQVSKPLLVFQINMLVSHNRWDGLDLQKKIQSFNQMTEIAKMLKLEKDHEMKDAVESFIRHHIWDFYGEIIDVIKSISIQVEIEQSRQIDEKKNEVVQQLQSLLDYNSTNCPTKAEIDKMIKPIAEYLNQAVQDAIDKYDYFKRNKTLRK